MNARPPTPNSTPVPTQMSIAHLPWEVLEHIAGFCGQADVINLAIACPQIADAILPNIYQCIIIDAAPRSLQSSRPTREVGNHKFPCTVVRTIAGIKQCLDALASRPRYAAEVRSLICNGNIAISDNAFLPRVKEALGNLTNLWELAWSACPELPPSLLAQLCVGAARPLEEKRVARSPAIPPLEVLSVDLAIRPGEQYLDLDFPRLRALRVRPFLNADVLAWVSRLARTSTMLEDVELGRFLDSKLEVGSSYRFVGLSDVQCRSQPVAAVSGFFGSNVRAHRERWSLKRLALSQTDTSALDREHLARAADVQELEELLLTGSGNEDEANHRLLAHIIAAKPQLSKLTLDWRASHNTLVNLLSSCCSRLVSLSIRIRDMPRLVLEIISGVCAPTLRQLCLQLDTNFAVEDLAPLKELRALEVLRLPFTHTVHTWEVAMAVPKVKVIELTLQNTAATPRSAVPSSRAPNVGLLTSGILDAWNDQLPSPLQYANILSRMRSHAELSYVVIDGHVTCLRHDSSPLESFFT